MSDRPATIPAWVFLVFSGVCLVGIVILGEAGRDRSSASYRRGYIDGLEHGARLFRPSALPPGWIAAPRYEAGKLPPCPADVSAKVWFGTGEIAFEEGNTLKVCTPVGWKPL